MKRPKAKPSASFIDQMLGEASWLLSHAQALGDYGRHEEAAVELARAAQCEEQVACLLDAAGQELEATIHRVSAGSCFEQIGQFTRAVTLFRAALSGKLAENYRAEIVQLLSRCLEKARKELSRHAKRSSRKRAAATR